MAILPTPITQGISGFFRWWGGEMAACLPARLRERFGRTRQRLVIEVSEAVAAFLFVDNLEVSNRRARRRRNQPVDMDPTLLVRLDLSGYLRPEAG